MGGGGNIGRFLASLVAAACFADFAYAQTVGQEDRWWEQDQEVSPAQAPLDRGAVEHLGSGPHTLVIANGSAMTRLEYRSGLACKQARDEIRRQVALPENTSGIIYSRPRTSAFCVPH